MSVLWVVLSAGSGGAATTATISGAAGILVWLASKVPPTTLPDAAGGLHSSGLSAGFWEAEACSIDANAGAVLNAADFY